MSDTNQQACPHCGQAMPPKPDQPIAHKLRALLFCGRQVFRVEGRIGLWGTGRPIDGNGERLFCHVDRKGRGYPANPCKTLYRLDEISEEAAKAFCEAILGEVTTTAHAAGGEG